LNFQRFKRDEDVHNDSKKLLSNIATDIKSGTMENPLDFKTYKDWNKFPDKYLNQIEKLVLKIYTYDPIQHTKKESTCKAIDNIDL
jgi:hypothetical protein